MNQQSLATTGGFNILEILEQMFFSKMYHNNLLRFVNIPCSHYYDYIFLKFI